MLQLLAAHQLLTQLAAGLLAVALAASLVWLALPRDREPDTARHRGRRRAWRVRRHVARHAAPTYHPHHAAVAAGPSAFLGYAPSGELVLVDDEHTHELVGAAA